MTSFSDDLAQAGYATGISSGNTINSLQSELDNGPLVALIKYGEANHAVVVTGVSHGRVTFADPWGGVYRSYTEGEFSQRWQDLGQGQGGFIYTVRPN